MKEDDKTILLLAENNSIEEKISSLLKDKGYNIDTANSKDKNLINNITQPKLILIDKAKIGKTIKNNSKTKNIPVVLVSELNKPKNTEIDPSINYIKYPFKIKDFLKVVYRHIPIKKENIQKPITENTSGIFRINKKGQFIYVSDKLCSIIKKTKEELINHSTETSPLNNDIIKIINKINRKKNKNKTYTFEITLKHNKKQYNLQITRETNEKNKHIGYIGSITNNKKVENAIAALIKSQQKSHSIIASLDEGIIYYTQNNGVEFYNNTARTFFKKDIHGLKEKDITKLFSKIYDENKITLKENQYPINLTFKTGLSIYNKIIGLIQKNTHNTIRKNQNQNIIWISINTHPVYENDLSKPSSVVLSFRNISKEKEALTEITQSKNRLATLINSTPDLISLKDKNGRHIISNNAMLKLLNIQNNSYIGKTNKELTKNLKPKYKKILENWNSSIPINKATEKNITLTNGTKKTYDIIKIPVNEKNTNINGSVIFARDITIRKELEKKLEKTLKMKNIILNNTSSAIAYIKNNTYVWVNNRFAKLFGYTKNEIENKNTTLIYPFSQKEYSSFIHSIEHAFKTKDNHCFDFPAVCKEGNIIWAKFAGQLINNKNINEGSIWVIENISSQKQEKEILTLHKNQLEKLAQKQIIQINNLEKKLNQEINEHKMSIKILIELKEKYKTIFNTSNNSIITLKAKKNNTNTEFIITNINKHCQMKNNLVKEEIEGKKIQELYPENQTLLENINTVFTNGKSIHTQIYKNNKQNNALIYKLNHDEIAINY